MRLGLLFLDGMKDIHLKELVIEAADDQRGIIVGGRS